jgi:hypothetical protein
MSEVQEIKLETALQREADHPAERPEFYRILMASSSYVLGRSAGEAVDGHVDLNAGDHISIHHWENPDGTTAIPMFSPLAVLQRAIEAENEYLKQPARDFSK